MHQYFLIIGDALQIIGMGSVILYAPFARTWSRAIWVPFIASFVWCAFRMTIIEVYREPYDSPWIVVLALPVVCAFYACIARILKLLIFMIPFLHRLEGRFRTRLSRKVS